MVVVSSIVFAVMIGFTISASAQEESVIPDWIKTAVTFWVQDQISDLEFINIIQYFVENEIITVPPSDDRIIENLQIFQSELNEKIQQSQALRNNAQIQQAIKESNKEFLENPNFNSLIENRESEWVSTEKNQIIPLMYDLMQNDAAKILQAIVEQDQKSDSLFTYAEIFVTNSYGVNVAMTGKTSDYIQNDEVWWTEAQQNGIYLEEGVFDESAGVYASDIALKIVDDKGNFIGVMKAVINVELLITTDQ
ncbi:MAG: cache domain-containing protein [Thaumarchaeota archaeon]|nr:cache domain-containing protein [Nitrososphaerota archaeon]